MRCKNNTKKCSKTHEYLNKFAKITIITYCKTNLILTSKCTLESFQVSLNINFIKYMLMWRSSITSSIYRLLMPLAHKNIHQHVQKKEPEKKLGKEFDAYLFKCLYLSFSFSLILLLLLLLSYLDFILTFPFFFFFFG